MSDKLSPWIPTFGLALISFMTLACGGGGGGGSSSESLQTNSSESVQQVTIVQPATAESKPDFSYQTVENRDWTISVNGIDPNKPACKIQIRMMDMQDGEEFGIWTGHMKQDGIIKPCIATPKANQTFRLIVQQAGKTTQLMLSQYRGTEFFFQPSFMKDIHRDQLLTEHIELIDIPTIIQEKVTMTQREKVPGETEYIDRNINVPQTIIQTVSALLPESVMPSAAYLDKRYNPNLPIVANAEIEVTFIHEGAGYRNTFGYFTYTLNEQGEVSIIDRQLIFPNASYLGSGGKLKTGDTSKLRDTEGNIRVFLPGETVGFFVIANGYNGSQVTGWDDPKPIYPSKSPAINLGPAQGTMTTLDMINPEMAANRPDINRHVAMIKTKGINGFLNGDDFIILGIEDIRRNRNSDNDFNDCVIIISASPIEAIGTENIISYDSESPDTDLDGVIDIEDSWPSDSTRAYSNRTPATGYATLVFEDLYPTVGDADYNDLVVNYAYETVYNGFGEVKSVEGTYHYLARGSHLDHAFGVAFRQCSSNTAGTIDIERFDHDGTRRLSNSSSISSHSAINLDGSKYIRILNLADSTKSMLPGVDSGFANTQRAIPDQNIASSRMLMTFEQPIDSLQIGQAPFDPFLYVDNGYARIDIHLPGFEGFTDRPTTLPQESGSSSFLSDEGWPWVMNLPVDFQFPLEGTPIGTHLSKAPAYDDFDTWVSSKGQQQQDWYKRPKAKGEKEYVIDSLPSLKNRAWKIGK